MCLYKKEATVLCVSSCDAKKKLGGKKKARW